MVTNKKLILNLDNALGVKFLFLTSNVFHEFLNILILFFSEESFIREKALLLKTFMFSIFNKINSYLYTVVKKYCEFLKNNMLSQIP